MSETLKLCPFCGKDAVESPDSCPCNTHLYNMTRKDWNTRPIEDTLRREVARLTAERDALIEAARWVPCAERLPELDPECQTLSKTVATYSNLGSEGIDYCDLQDKTWMGDDVHEYTTHWFALPELPAPPEEV